MTKRFKLMLGLMAIIWLALAILRPAPHHAADARKHNAWFAARYDPDVPFYLTAGNAQNVLAAMPESARNAAKEALTKLAAPAETTEAAYKHPLTCAVVGNSGNLLGSRYGPLIDDHNYVFRMNNAPVKGYYKDVGSRTTHHILDSNFHPHIAVYDTKTITLSIVDEYPFDRSQKGDRDKYNAKVAAVLQWLTPQLAPGSPAPAALGFIFANNIPQLPGGFRIIHPAFLDYVSQRWFAPDKRKPYDYPSTGFKTIVLALHLCDRVDVFGFGINSQKKAWDHYFDEGLPLANFPSPIHRAEYQEEFLAELEQQGLIRLYRGNMGKTAVK